MVEEIVNNIIEAEDRARQIVLSAKEEAKAMLTAAREASEKKRADCAAQNRVLAEEARRAALASGQAEYDRILSEGEVEARAVSERYHAKTGEAAEKVLSAILG